MEEVRVNEPTQAAKKKSISRLLVFSFLEVGFVCILLMLIFITLEYFHILPISFFPFPLYFNRPSLNHTIPVQKIPIVDSSSFQKLLIISYVHSEINSSYIPNSLENAILVGQMRTFASWSVNEASGTASIAYEPNRKTIKLKEIMLSTTNASNTASLSPQNAPTLFQMLSTNRMKLTWTCNKPILCSSSATQILEGVQYKKLFYLFLDTIHNSIQFSECEVGKNSSLFSKLTNCP